MTSAYNTARHRFLKGYTPFFLFRMRQWRTAADDLMGDLAVDTSAADRAGGDLLRAYANRERRIASARASIEAALELKEQEYEKRSARKGVEPEDFKVGDLVRLQERTADGWSRKLYGAKSSGPWALVEKTGPSQFVAQIQGRFVRDRKVDTLQMRRWMSLPERLRLVGEVGVNLVARVFSAAAPAPQQRGHLLHGEDVMDQIMSIGDRRRTASQAAWEYQLVFRDGSVGSTWHPEATVLRYFSPHDLDVYHALYELYIPLDQQARAARRGLARGAAQRGMAVQRALRKFPAGTRLTRIIRGGLEGDRRIQGKIVSYQRPFFEVHMDDQDMDPLQLTEYEVEGGVQRFRRHHQQRKELGEMVSPGFRTL